MKKLTHETTPSNHKRNWRGESQRLTTEVFVQRATKVHADRYDYSLVNYVNAFTKVLIICKEHGVFHQEPHNHVKDKHGCPKCWTVRRAVIRRLTTEEFIQKAQTVHGDRYNYSRVEYFDNATKVPIICSEHGVFHQRPGNHMSGAGCPFCRDECTSTRFKSNIDDFIQRSREVHGNRYDYAQVRYIGDGTKVAIICKEHGVFQQTPHDHKDGHGCPICGNEATAALARLTPEEFIQRAKKVHGDEYDYSEVKFIKNIDTKVPILCQKHGLFHQRPHNHLIGNGCPKCNPKSSRAEQRWLISQGVPEEYWQYKIPGSRLEADGYDPRTNTIYEFDGDFFHGNPKLYNPQEVNQVSGKAFGELYEATLARRQAIRNLGYKLVWIWCSDFKSQEEQLAKKVG